VLTVFSATHVAVNGVDRQRRHGQSVERVDDDDDQQQQDQNATVEQRADDRARRRNRSAAEGRQRIQRSVRQVSARQRALQKQGECVSSGNFRNKLRLNCIRLPVIFRPPSCVADAIKKWKINLREVAQIAQGFILVHILGRG